MNLVFGWKQAYKWLSVQVSAIGAAVALSWPMLTPEQQDAILQFVGLPPGTLVAIMFASVVVSRIIAQPALSKPPTE